MKTVLTVDDSKVVRTMVTRHLKAWICEVIEASNGKEGVEAAQWHKPDLILLDVTMPVMDGREALENLRKDPACRGIPVIMLTAESGRDLVMEIVKLRVTGYIIKPFDQETFEKEVSKVLGPAGANAPLDAESVLIIDDSEKVLVTAKAALEQSFTVLTALSGAEGIAEYQRARPATVVIDLAMPDMDGFATLEQIQQLGRSYFVALAVRGDKTLQERARKAGYGAIVEKPFQGATLHEQVVAAAMNASPEEFLQKCFAEEAGCPVLHLDMSATKKLTRSMSLITKKLRALAEDGNDKLILDIAALSEVSPEQITLLARVLTEAGGLGIRTAVCTANEQVLGTLRQIVEIRSAPSAPTCEQARACLQ